MTTRWVLVVLASVVALVACGKAKEPVKKGEPAPAAQKEAAAGEAKAGEAKAGEAKAGEAKAGEAKAGEAKAGEAKAGEGEKPAEAPAAAETGVDKEKLTQTYQEVYCAQKKGEMDKILGIYKAHGFGTPQDFTKAWIEAAKDTDWVTKIAHEVGKKCQ